MESPVKAYENIPFINSDTCRPVRLQLEYLHPETVIKEHAIRSTIVLFGSYARGEDTARSDIDIAIIGAREKPLDLSSYGTVLARTVNVSWFLSLDDLSVPMRESLWSGIPLI